MIQEQKNKFKQYGLLVAIVLAVICVSTIIALMSGNNSEDKSQQANKPTALETVSKDFTINSKKVAADKDVWIAKSEEEVASLQQENDRLQRRMKEMQDRILHIEEKGKKEALNRKDETPIVLPSSQNSNLSSLSLPMTLPNQNPSTQPTPASSATIQSQQTNKSPKPTEVEEERKMTVVTLGDGNTEAKKNEKSKRNISHYIPSGAFAKAVLLSGVDAPTGGQAQTNPMPILLRLVGRGILPNFADSQVKNCHTTGAAYGDLSSERAHIRLERLSCVLKSGEVIETPIKGYVAGEDGKSGLRGRLVSKQGSMIAKAAMAGVFSGIGQSISSQYQTISSTALGQISSVDPRKAGENGIAQGASSALDKIADYYFARANEMYPIIEIDARRIGEIVLTEGVDLGTEIVGKIRENK